MFARLKALATALVLVAISAGIATIAVPEKKKMGVAATEPLPPPPLIAAIVIAMEGDKKVEVAPPTAPSEDIAKLKLFATALREATAKLKKIPMPSKEWQKGYLEMVEREAPQTEETRRWLARERAKLAEQQ